MNNTRFATVLHMLAMLADNEGEWLSSDWIASSININPVMVRKELGVLQERGWVVSRKGKLGGSMLQKPASGISLADIYALVKNTEVLGRKNHHTNTQCPIGKDINKQLDELFFRTDGLVSGYLQEITLDAFVKRFR